MRGGVEGWRDERVVVKVWRPPAAFISNVFSRPGANTGGGEKR